MSIRKYKKKDSRLKFDKLLEGIYKKAKEGKTQQLVFSSEWFTPRVIELLMIRKIDVTIITHPYLTSLAVYKLEW